MFTTIILPKDGSRELVTEVHKSLFYSFLQGEQVNLPLLMLDLICQCFRNPKRSMPYACPITSLLLFIGIAIPQGEMVTLSSRNSYDLTAVHRMGYRMVDGEVSRELKGQAVDGPAQEDDDSSDDTSHDEPMDAPDAAAAAGDAGFDADAVEADVHAPSEPSLREFLSTQLAQMQHQMNARFDQLDIKIDALADAQQQLQQQLFSLSSVVHGSHQSPSHGTDDV